MTGDVREYAARNAKLVELAGRSAGYGHFAMLCALEGIEPWTPGMYGVYVGCMYDESGRFDVWKALSE